VKRLRNACEKILARRKKKFGKPIVFAQRCGYHARSFLRGAASASQNEQ